MGNQRTFCVEKSCVICGESFKASTNKKVFCSPRCGHRSAYQANMMDYQWRLSKLLAMAKNRANTKSVPFNLDVDYLIDLWDENDGCCQVSGIEFELERAEKGKVHPYAPSLDRETPEKGYVKGNVRIVCYQLNVALSEFGLDQFEEFIRLYRNNNPEVFVQ